VGSQQTSQNDVSNFIKYDERKAAARPTPGKPAEPAPK
jgi:hypothetical protein